MQLYVGDYLADTLDLTCEEHGAYLLLLMTMWRHDAKLPSDPKKLARIARLSGKKWIAVWAEIGKFFDDDGTHITNKRLTKEHQKATDKSKVRATAGSAGGKAKSLKKNKPDLANATDLPKHSSEPDIKNRDTNVSLVHRDLFQAKDFADFWDAYPHRNGKKKNRQGAEAAFARAIKAGATIAAIAAGVEAMRRDPDVIRGYARDPTTWLNQRGWTDEIPETQINGSNYGNITDRSKQSANRPQNRIDPAVANIARIVGIGHS